MGNHIKVIPTAAAGDLVVLSERDPSHPGGEVFIRGYSDAAKRKPTTVGETRAVQVAILNGLLEIVKPPTRSKKSSRKSSGKGGG